METGMDHGVSDALDDVSKALGFHKCLNVTPLDAAAAFMRALRQTDEVADKKIAVQTAESSIMGLFTGHEDFVAVARTIPFSQFITHDLLNHITLDATWIERDNVSLSNQELNNMIHALSKSGNLTSNHQKNICSILSKLKITSDQAVYLYNADLPFLGSEVKGINLTNVSDCGFQYFFHMQSTVGMAKNGIYVSNINKNISSFTLCEVLGTQLQDGIPNPDAWKTSRRIQEEAKEWANKRTERPHKVPGITETRHISPATAKLFAVCAKGFMALHEGRPLTETTATQAFELSAIAESQATGQARDDASAITGYAHRKLINQREAAVPKPQGQEAQHPPFGQR